MERKCRTIPKRCSIWYGTWKAAGKPNIGDIYDKMKKSRNQYQYVVRRAEKDLDNIKSNSLNEAASTNNRTFLLELKKTLSKQKTKQKFLTAWKVRRQKKVSLRSSENYIVNYIIQLILLTKLYWSRKDLKT